MLILRLYLVIIMAMLTIIWKEMNEKCMRINMIIGMAQNIVSHTITSTGIRH